MNLTDFYNCICKLPDNHKNRDLEEYLLALHPLLLQNIENTPSFDLFHKLLEEAFTSKPTDLNNEWLDIINPPEHNSNLTDFEYLIEVVKFQIADLHKMKNKQVKNEMKYFGIDSETDHRWYNFDPFTNLECGVSGIMNGNSEKQVTWATLGEIIEYGRIYE